MSYAIRNDGQGWRAVNAPEDVGIDETFSQEIPSPAAPSLAEIKRLKLTEIELAADAAIAPITSVYPLAERDTWPIQEAEAVAWTADPLAPTPVLNAIASARSLPLADVVSNVLAKAAAFKSLAGTTFGKRKSKIDQVTDVQVVGGNVAAAIAAVEAITW